MNDAVTIKTVRGPAGLKEIHGAWDAIAHGLKEREYFFHRREWYQSYLEALEGNPDSVNFHLVSRGNEPVAVLPLRSVQRQMYAWPVRVWEVPHHPHMLLSDFVCGAGAADESLLRTIVEYLRSSAPHDWDVILLPNVLENSCAERCLKRYQLDRVLRETSARCDFLEYAGYEEFLGAVSKNFRGNLRKARNKLAKMEASFVFVSDRRQLPEAFERFCEVEASGWKGQQGTGTAIELDPRLKAFYRALIDNFGSTDACQINLLMLGESCLAGQFCLRSNGILHVLKIGYDESHGAVAPGNMLLEQLIQRSAFSESRMTRLNLITGVRWHDDWQPRSEKVSNIWIYNHGARAAALYRLASCGHQMKGAMKGLRNRVGSRRVLEGFGKRDSGGGKEHDGAN